MTAHAAAARRGYASLLAFTIAGAVVLVSGDSADAAIVPTVPLGTAANYSVLGAETVTNSGPTTLALGLGVWPGTTTPGFGPGATDGKVAGETHAGDTVAAQAQADLTVAYNDAAGRTLTANVPSELADENLQGGVYAGPGKSALTLNGTLTLDGAGDPRSVFIFQTNSSLITGPASRVALINGAQECNVFWQVGSSATLGDASVSFTGNILALTTVTVSNAVTVRGRALADTGEVTLINDTFTAPTCAVSSAATTSTTSDDGGVTPTTAGDGGTTATTGGGGGTTGGGGGGGGSATTGTTGGGGGTATSAGRPRTPVTLTSGGPGVPGVVGPPRTGGAPLRGERSPSPALAFAILLGVAMTAGLVLRHRADARHAPPSER